MLTTDALAELIDRRHDCLSELLGLARQQQESAAADDMDGLLAILARKQPCLEALQRISAALRPFREENAEDRIWSDPSYRARCQARWDECAAMHEEIVQLERTSESTLRERRDQVGRQLHASHWAHQAHRAYLRPSGPAASPAGSQFDLRET
jgi:hypothetical protein